MSTPQKQSSEKNDDTNNPKRACRRPVNEACFCGILMATISQGDSLVVGPVEKGPNPGPSTLKLVEKEPEEIKSEPDDDYDMMEEEEEPKVGNKRKRHY